jgi:tetratricopeptide (TPR) repeat protein
VQLSVDERKELQEQRAGFQQTLSSAPGDLPALEGAAVSAARLGDYKDAEALLTQLVVGRPDDVDAWRLLGETRTALRDTKGAVQAGQRAFELQPETLSLARTYAYNLVDDGQPEAAIAAVRAMTGAGGQGGQESLSDIEGQLLLAKVYLKWPGHNAQAAAIYDQLTTKYPDDFRCVPWPVQPACDVLFLFWEHMLQNGLQHRRSNQECTYSGGCDRHVSDCRGFLAKGILLHAQGRQADSDRAFLKAKYLAPAAVRGVVDDVSGASTRS